MIRCIAIDDEPLALEQLSAYIKKVPYLELTSLCHDAYEAMKALEDNDVDAVFADINMPDLSGIDFVRSLAHPPIVVFTTAHSAYAVEGYKVNAIDYLLKPFSFEEFLATADKVRRRHELLLSATSQQQTDSIYVKSNHRMCRVAIASIRYVEGMSEYVRIYTDDTAARPLTTLVSMRRLEDMLPRETFLRVHKSYIVNMQKVQSLCKTSVQIDADTFIPVGEAYRDTVINFVEKRYIGK